MVHRTNWECITSSHIACVRMTAQAGVPLLGPARLPPNCPNTPHRPCRSSLLPRGRPASSPTQPQHAQLPTAVDCAARWPSAFGLTSLTAATLMETRSTDPMGHSASCYPPNPGATAHLSIYHVRLTGWPCRSLPAAAGSAPPPPAAATGRPLHPLAPRRPAAGAVLSFCAPGWQGGPAWRTLPCQQGGSAPAPSLPQLPAPPLHSPQGPPPSLPPHTHPSTPPAAPRPLAPDGSGRAASPAAPWGSATAPSRHLRLRCINGGGGRGASQAKQQLSAGYMWPPPPHTPPPSS